MYTGFPQLQKPERTARCRLPHAWLGLVPGGHDAREEPTAMVHVAK
jgi:hypothetical protein